MLQTQAVWQANMQVYCADKVGQQMNRKGTTVARCAFERLMKHLGLQGVSRGKWPVMLSAKRVGISLQAFILSIRA